MEFTEKNISGLFVITPKIYSDQRGWFYESFREKLFEKYTGKKYRFIQDNCSFSGYGVIRGLHYQVPPYSQSKIIQVFQGKILDVTVDLRPSSPTYLRQAVLCLEACDHKQLFIPEGIAHGFSVLSQEAVVFYKTNRYYNPSSERTLLYNDTDLNIDWKIPQDKARVSEKDRKGTPLKTITASNPFQGI